VWDRSAAIKFVKPGKSALTGIFRIDWSEVARIRQELETRKSIDRVFSVELKDMDGAVCAVVEKTLYIGKPASKNRQAVRSIYSKLF
jgi:hypothetical protein